MSNVGLVAVIAAGIVGAFVWRRGDGESAYLLMGTGSAINVALQEEGARQVAFALIAVGALTAAVVRRVRHNRDPASRERPLEGGDPE